MPKLFSSRHLVNILIANGFVFVSQKGSHGKFKKSGKASFTVIVPMNRKEIPYGTFRSIVRQSNLNEADFEK